MDDRPERIDFKYNLKVYLELLKKYKALFIVLLVIVLIVVGIFAGIFIGWNSR